MRILEDVGPSERREGTERGGDYGCRRHWNKVNDWNIHDIGKCVWRVEGLCKFPKPFANTTVKCVPYWTTKTID